jgi:hypothetical protein
VGVICAAILPNAVNHPIEKGQLLFSSVDQGTRAHGHPSAPQPSPAGFFEGGVGTHGERQNATSTTIFAPCGGTQQTRPDAQGR